MATKAAVRESEVNDQTETNTDGPLMDSVTAAVKKLIAKGKERGYITIDELNAVMPPDDSASEQIEDVMTLFSEMGVNVIENEEAEEASSASSFSMTFTPISENKVITSSICSEAESSGGITAFNSSIVI